MGSQTKNIPYHFTLGGGHPVEQEKDWARLAEEACGEMPRFEINMGPIGLFGLNVLFIAPNMNFELLSLRQRFYPDGGNGCHEWTAHATVLIDGPENILKALPLLAENHKPFTARIESVCLYEFWPARLITEQTLR